MERVKALQLAHSWLGHSKQQIQNELAKLSIEDATQLYATYNNIDLITRLNAQPDPIEDHEALQIINPNQKTHYKITNQTIQQGINEFLNDPKRLVEAALAEAHHNAIIKLYKIASHNRNRIYTAIIEILAEKGLVDKDTANDPRTNQTNI